ncbi:sigma-54-dependent Fis family transcriptional regulator [Paracoccus aminophilus]|uniref:Nif-specific regulatory protein n=1 Tax=Paracoccus aminophilus JCM 7686 TaxID=1367847 RepID=S5YHF4_PARAH|nr:sigma-54-dependent Fis family transcriptional regulator [Paracoccus aminophilus]AGT10893.1 Fis family GAF modulated sigma54 specific transcriptional regulator [Paracoccus aminophilus JCM 7686]
MTDLLSGFHTRTGMFDDWLDQRATMRAWEDFLTYRDIDHSRTSGVRREILESWSRSLESGIDATAELAPLDETEELLEDARQKNADLRAAAHAPFEKMGPLLAGTNALLILTDAEGLVLEQTGDLRTHSAARGIHLVQGGKWDEAAIGTNGIGTAIRSGRPTVVHASEHFCQGIKAWTCAAAPVRDSVDQRIIGVVDLSGPSSIFRPHNVAMIAAVAREIEAALAERQEMRRTRLLEVFLDSGPARSSRDAVVILDHIGRVMYHRQPSVSEGAEPDAPKLLLGQQFIPLTCSMSDHEIAQAVPAHLRPSGISRLFVDGQFSGAALILPPRGAMTAASAPKAIAPVRIPPRAGAERDELLMIGQSPKFVGAVDIAKRSAAAASVVLVQGETGVGKELFARLIHASGGHQGRGPFVTLNCGAISPELFGAELFGHAPGAFTGATREGKPGKFEQADGGVLCLDEIGEMPLELQPYLLRVLEQRAVYRIGCAKRRQVDVQLVAMTNRDLIAEVEAGRFRRDLYYRLGAITIEVPPLRERPCDIPALADHFNRAVATRLGRAPLVLSDEAATLMSVYGWPGNVREMRNLFERLHLMVTGAMVTAEDLPMALRTAPGALALAAALPVEEPAPANLTEMEEQAIRRALISEAGNLTRVALVLGISRPTLYRKLKTYGIRRTYE